MVNYADYLAHFDFDVVFKPTELNVNTDYSYRIPQSKINKMVNSPLTKVRKETSDKFDQFVLHQIKQLPIRAETITQHTRKDQHLDKIIQLLESGRNLTHAGYKVPEAKYTLAINCLMFEHRVVIPPTLRQQILNDLHAAHVGIVKMKGMAHSFVYWPGVDGDIEKTAKSCTECAQQEHVPPKFRSHHWEYPNAP